MLGQPLLVCDSPGNRLAAERLCSKPSRDPRGVTVFTRDSESDPLFCVGIIPTIDEHHPGWTEIAVVGALVTPAVRECFAPFAPGRFLDSPAGFSFVRAGVPY
jgi:hypothetical protein